MTHATAESANKTAEKIAAERLDHRYRQIGISAVAAAARYHGIAKNPAYAPAPSNWDNRREIP